MTNQLWTVVLAAGAGRRLAGLTGDMPKQFWRAGDRQSLLEETADRFAPLAPPSRTVVIVDHTHREYVTGVDADEVGSVIFQPEDRGTAAGVLLALTPVLEADPGAVVAITPADHGVINVTTFRRGLLEAARHVRSDGGIVLFGVEPTGAHADYGWITPGASPSSHRLRRVTSFIEKPSTEMAEQLFASGAVWNTMVVVARASAVRALYVEVLPELASVFDAALRLSSAERSTFLSAVYPQLHRFDFSHDLLTPARDLLTYIWPASVGWSDLGTPERLRAWHRHAAVSSPRHAITAA